MVEVKNKISERKKKLVFPYQLRYHWFMVDLTHIYRFAIYKQREKKGNFVASKCDNIQFIREFNIDVRMKKSDNKKRMRAFYSGIDKIYIFEWNNKSNYAGQCRYTTSKKK